MPELHHTYELTLEVINHSPHAFYFYSQVIAPHQDNDLNKEYNTCNQELCTINLNSQRAFTLEISNPKLNQEHCYIDHLKIKRLRFQSFLRKNPHRGTYRIEIPKANHCNITSTLIEAEKQSWFNFK